MSGNDWSTEEQLRSFLEVTDTALTRLDVEDLLNELLIRVQRVLDADTAVVFLLDEPSQELVATAARGLEEEVRLGVRIPVGVGFAGQVAKTRKPVLLERVDSTTVANPILWQKGIKVMLGVPLIVVDDLIGVLHVGRFEDKPFVAEETEILEVVAERVAAAAQTRRLAVERAAAVLLERSLLPGRMPACKGLDLAARYQTPEDRSVGGDWYDLFVGPQGELWVVVGDVVGHGLAAAVVMGRVRSALRSYTLLGVGPDEVLSLTDRKVLHFEVDSMVTLVCATSSPPYDEFTVSVAGHPPPIVAGPGAPARVAEVPVDAPLGFSAESPRRVTTLELPPGGLMVLYTDGLVERRGEVIDEGIERLCSVVEVAPAQEICNRVLLSLIGDDQPTDDVAVVAIRRSN